MLEKLKQSIKTQREQLHGLLENKEAIELNLKGTIEAIHQLRGAVAALEYVVSLHDEPKDENN